MNKYFSPLVGCLMLMGCSQYSYLDELPPPELPTVFFISRQNERLSDKKQDEIIAAANSYLNYEIKEGEIENVLIIDEGDKWYVYFGWRGNGMFQQPKRGRLGYVHPIQDWFNAIYLDKRSLVIAPIPEGNLETGLYRFATRIDDFQWNEKKRRNR